MRRGETGGVDHEEELDQMVVHRRRAGLHEEDICAADRLAVSAVRLAVRERFLLDRTERRAKSSRDSPCELGIRGTCEDERSSE
jgi:hypothetical protein